MAKKRTLTDTEFERQYEAAGTEPPEPLILEASYRADLGLVWVELTNECVFGFPPHLVEGLADELESTIATVEVLGGGCGLHWESLDLDLSVTGLLMGSFGTRAFMREIARKGGESTSAAKAEAARRNGRKGGRPRSNARSEAEEPPHPQSGHYWDSREPPVAHSGKVADVVAVDDSAGVAFVARDDSQTTPGGWSTSRSSATPSSQTPARAA